MKKFQSLLNDRRNISYVYFDSLSECAFEAKKKQQFQKWKPKWYWPMVVFCHPLIWLIGILLKIYLPFNYIRWLFNIHSVYMKSISIDDGSRQWKYVWRQSSETNLFFFQLWIIWSEYFKVYMHKRRRKRDIPERGKKWIARNVKCIQLLSRSFTAVLLYYCSG